MSCSKNQPFDDILKTTPHDRISSIVYIIIYLYANITTLLYCIRLNTVRFSL